MYSRTITIVFLLAFSIALRAAGNPLAPSDMAPNFTAMTSTDSPFELENFRGQWVVFEWTNHECPYVRKHYSSGNMQKTQRLITEDGGIWVSIISSAPGKQGYVTPEEANQLTASRGVYADMILLDPSGEIGRLYMAKTTPQMFLINPAGYIEYMGAIDDKPSSRQASLTGAKNYVLNAWEAAKAGKEINPKVTKPYGCTVKY
ncbi:MAG: redoxin domain-containing protein [Alphaproteobacteria bacterium]|nr:redoxin domain-containing protein [Alphaproteobacteria bacterium]